MLNAIPYIDKEVRPAYYVKELSTPIFDTGRNSHHG